MRGILTWHSIDESGSVISMTPAAFERQLDAIARRGIQVVSLREVASRSDESDAVALTFDDGFANFLEVAAPALLERGFTATVFVVTSHVGGRNDWPSSPGDAPVPILPLMSWNDLHSLTDKGFEIGAHSVTHRRLDRLPPADTVGELIGCRETIARNLGVTPQSFAYPYGACDGRSRAEAARTFALCCTTRFAALSAHDPPDALPRLDSYYLRDVRLIDMWGTPLFKSYVSMRNAGRAVRALLGSGR